MDPQVLDARMAPDEFVSEMSLGGPVGTEEMPDDTLLAESNLPTYDNPNVSPSMSNVGVYAPTYGPVFGGGSPGMPGVTSPSGPGTAPVPPIAPVPEPGSWLLVATGGVIACAMLRRRLVGA